MTEPPPQPSHLQHLWSPDRLAYIQGENRPSTDDAGNDCPFCRAPDSPVDEGLVVALGATVYALLNLYPYNAGHLMVCPYRHIASYADATTQEAHEMADLTRQAMQALDNAYAPHGYNLGMNLGYAGGAGIAGHLHQHVVPRWGGDTNFMPVVAKAKVIPQALSETRRVLEAAWPGAGH